MAALNSRAVGNAHSAGEIVQVSEPPPAGSSTNPILCPGIIMVASNTDTLTVMMIRQDGSMRLLIGVIPGTGAGQWQVVPT